MKKMLVVVLCATFTVVLFSEALLAIDKGQEFFTKGQKLFTRTNLRTNGEKIFFHNFSLSPGFIPVGTSLIVKKVGRTNSVSKKVVGKDTIQFQLIDNLKTYTLKVLPEHYDKYFVEDIKEIELENINNDAMLKIKEMTVAPGMTKKEVYISRGCPSYIAYGDISLSHTLDQIMKSDTWYYNSKKRSIEMLVKFENNVVVEIEKIK